MRKSAYKKALEEANQLPETLPELSRYFKDNISVRPRDMAIRQIKTMARKDEALFDSELIEVLRWPH